MSAVPQLLSDEQMRHFIEHGYVVLHTDFSEDFHAALNARIAAVMQREGNPGNNILPRVPEVQEVVKHPAFTGAVSSVLGEDYIMQPHRHCHYTEPGRKVQSWHKDSYWGYARIRNHHQWWAMVFYYPQNVTAEMGPSGLLPGTHFYDKRPGDDTEQPLYLEGSAGTFALIHYDLWHRGGANQSQQNRAMIKFQFTRVSRPQAPTWQNENVEWKSLNGEGPAHSHNSLWTEQWNWMSGRPHTLDSMDMVPTVSHADLIASIQSEYEPKGIGAAYDLATEGNKGLAPLYDLLRGDNPHATRRAAYGLSAGSPEAIPMLVQACNHESDIVRRFSVFALGEHGPKAAPFSSDVVNLLDDESPWVRRTAVETLGMLGDAETAVPALTQTLSDEDDQVKFNSALALARYGREAASAAPALFACLQDENRYVRGFGIEALRQIGTPEALGLACDHLMNSRWCYSTTPDSTF